MFSFGNEIPRYSCHPHYRGYRRVTLEKGVNTMFLRVENKPGGTGFAVYIQPPAIAGH